jgi:3-oxoacyl-[acyl-carrier-protein] synthase-3
VLGVAIRAWGLAAPQATITNEELANLLGVDERWIQDYTGVRERRIVSHGEATSDLAVEAATRALARTGLEPADIAMLILATSSPDQPAPATAALVHSRLGLLCGAFDLNAHYAGFVYGVVLGGTLARLYEAPVLVIGADAHSGDVNPSDLEGRAAVGDGAGALIMVPSDLGGLLSFDLGCDGSAASLIEIPAGGSRRPATFETVASGQHYLQTSGTRLYEHFVQACVNSIEAALEQAGVSISDINLFVPHQANARIITAIAERLSLPRELMVSNIDHFGNTGCASVPMALAEAADAGRLAPGNLVLLSSFGAGMAWASAVLRWTTV